MPNTAQETLATKQALAAVRAHFQSSFVDQDVRGRLNGFTTDQEINARVHFYDAQAFQAGRTMCNKPGGAGCVAAYVDADFASQQDHIYVQRGIAGAGTLIHEILHVCTHPNFFNQLATNQFVYEGLTEYYTRKIYVVERQSYSREVALMQDVVQNAYAGDETDCLNAMFKGNHAAIQNFSFAVKLSLQQGQPVPGPQRAQGWQNHASASTPRNPNMTIGRNRP